MFCCKAPGEIWRGAACWLLVGTHTEREARRREQSTEEQQATRISQYLQGMRELGRRKKKGTHEEGLPSE